MPSLSRLIHEAPPTNPDVVQDSCSDDSDEEVAPKPLAVARAGQSSTAAYRTPLAVRQVGSANRTPSGLNSSIGRNGNATPEQRLGPVYYYTVQWRRPQTKKHKTWDGDAFLRIEGKKITMVNEEGDRMATSALVSTGGTQLSLPASGDELRIGQYDVEIDNEISAAEFKSSTIILNKPKANAAPASYAPSTFARPFKAPSVTHAPKPAGGPIYAMPSTRTISSFASNQVESLLPSDRPSRAVQPIRKEISPDQFYSASAASKPRGERIVLGEKSKKQRMEWGGALHNPNEEDAVVMQRPDDKEAKKRGADIVDVVLDPFLTKKMRSHQREGVKFMYSCVMGLTGAEAQGCILADEMGLGKTLQTIALIYTLLKQSPFSDESSVIGKALVVCPVSLVDNWRKEFRKWIRPDQLTVVAADTNEAAIKSFTHHRGQHVLIIGYERLRKVIKQLASCQPPIDLVVCDEGHRLKSKDNKTTKMFEALRTRRRIILSGTPVQNDLSEYFAMVDFTCPGLLGRYPQFVKHYEKPIMKSRTPGCSEAALEEGRERADELGKLSKEFVLRRTAAVLENYLPPKHEYVVFVAPSVYQLNALSRILSPDLMRLVARGETGQAFGYIDLMRKVANTPTIMRFKRQDEGNRSEHMVQVGASALKDLPSSMSNYDVSASGKLYALDRIVHALHTTTEEKVVIVSNFTSTLDIIQGVCKARRYPYLRLDGSTPQKQRQDLVDQFNRQRRQDSFVFLLSAKAGGVGLNLIGGSRLILFDSDWNPSTDLQAMARIHRDGQKRPVYIYRFLTANSIDEKIYQRQITKTGLAEQMMDHNSVQERTKDSFTAAELRDIFSVNLHTDGCQTHDLLVCDCISKGGKPTVLDSRAGSSSFSDNDDDESSKGFMLASQYDPEPTAKMVRKAAVEQRQKLAALKQWQHIDGFDEHSFKDVADTILYNMLWENLEKFPARTVSTATTTAITTPSRDLYGLDGVAPDSEASDDEVPVLRRSKKPRVVTAVDPLEGLFTDDDGKAPDSGAELSMSEDEVVRLPRKRKVSGKASGSDKASGPRKHNLQDLADRGQAGRIMFVFERVSSSKIGEE